ncbi:expressed protein [Phakopsora pachyrhizi]|uniref:Expressed protein n=1 Tax=Phakopsora pachyrhizi TaxID=170000 RepID=A0AAV0AU03_PHAPC|nr:expressed protein [Phakopsora pachyrhizi]
MQFLIAASLVFLALQGVSASDKKATVPTVSRKPNTLPHTFCYNFFYKKTRVSLVLQLKKTDVIQIKRTQRNLRNVEHPNKRHAKQRVLTKRYDDEGSSFFINSGSGICGVYDSNQPGACLFSGYDDSGANSALASDANLPEEKRNVQYAPVVDGCSFNLGGNSAKKNGDGCFRIGVTNHTFFALNPTAGEIQNGTISQLLWDFDAESSDDKAKENGPF